MTYLLDGNLLIALVVEDHMHHDIAKAWFGEGRAFATCPITQGTLLRLLLREGVAATDAQAVLAGLTGHDEHEFWSDSLDFGSVDLARVVGHRQVTDAYLAQLARAHAGRLATLDGGVMATHPDVSEPVRQDSSPSGVEG